MTIPVNTAPPRYGVTYSAGWAGFTNQPGLVTAGIDHFERREDGSLIVSHALVVESENTCIEAVMGGGVIRSTLTKYTTNPGTRIYFRKPRGLTSNIADAIVGAAVSKLGHPYNSGLIVSELMAQSALGRLVNKVFHQLPHRIIAALLDNKTDYICSELLAFALSSRSEYANLGVLADPLDTIDPEDIFTDIDIFEAFINDCSIPRPRL